MILPRAQFVLCHDNARRYVTICNKSYIKRPPSAVAEGGRLLWEGSPHPRECEKTDVQQGKVSGKSRHLRLGRIVGDVRVAFALGFAPFEFALFANIPKTVDIDGDVFEDIQRRKKKRA